MDVVGLEEDGVAILELVSICGDPVARWFRVKVPVGEDSESVVGEEGVAVGDTVPERLFTKHLARD